MTTTMLIGNRGISRSTKSVMKELMKIVKCVEETQFDLKKKFDLLSSYMDINECDSTIFFETTKRVERLWLATAEMSIRFTVESLESIFEMCNTVNFHSNAGHVLCFSEDFDEREELCSVKDMFQKVFSSDKDLPVERALSFFYVNGSIYIRNYLLGQEGLEEIGPRMKMKLDKILGGCFRGNVLYCHNKTDTIEEAE